jgi:transposase
VGAGDEPRRDVPKRYGPWQSVYSIFRQYQLAGSCTKLVTALQALADARGPIAWAVSVDSTIVRAHGAIARCRVSLRTMRSGVHEAVGPRRYIWPANKAAS